MYCEVKNKGNCCYRDGILRFHTEFDGKIIESRVCNNIKCRRIEYHRLLELYNSKVHMDPIEKPIKQKDLIENLNVIQNLHEKQTLFLEECKIELMDGKDRITRLCNILEKRQTNEDEYSMKLKEAVYKSEQDNKHITELENKVQKLEGVIKKQSSVERLRHTRSCKLIDMQSNIINEYEQKLKDSKMEDKIHISIENLRVRLNETKCKDTYQNIIKQIRYKMHPDQAPKEFKWIFELIFKEVV